MRPNYTWNTQVIQHPTDYAQYPCKPHCQKMLACTHTCIVMAVETLKQDPRVINTCGFGLQNMGSDCRQHAAPSSLACHSLLPALAERSGPWKVTCKVIWRVFCSCVKGLVTNARQPNNSIGKNLSTFAKTLYGVCVYYVIHTMLCLNPQDMSRSLLPFGSADSTVSSVSCQTAPSLQSLIQSWPTDQVNAVTLQWN